MKWALAKVTVLGGRQSSKNTVGVWGLGCGITGQVSDTRFTLSETKIRPDECTCVCVCDEHIIEYENTLKPRAQDHT